MSLSKQPQQQQQQPALPDQKQQRQRRRQRHALLFFNVLTTLFFVGAPLGWGPMQLLLEENGAYADKCSDEDQENGIICGKQTSSLVKIGLSITITQITAPVLGYVSDKIGPRRTAYLQALMAVVGLSLIVVAVFAKFDILLNIGFAILAVQTVIGALIIVHLGMYFHGHMTSRVIFVLNTVFDSGTIVYLGLWGIAQLPKVSSPHVLLGYLCFGIVLYSTSSYLWRITIPESDQETGEENMTADRKDAPEIISSKKESPGPLQVDQDNSNDTLQGTSTNLEEMEDPKMSSEIVVVTVKESKPIKSKAFGLMCTFFALGAATSNWNIATQRDFLASLGDDDRNNLYLTIFTLLTPVSILGTPFMDWVILRYDWPTALQVVNMLSVSFQVVKVATENLNAQILGFFIYSFYRAFFYGVSFSFLPHLVDSPLVGRASGIMVGCAGITNLLLIPFVDMAVGQGETNFLLVNLIVLSLTIPSVIVVRLLAASHVTVNNF